MNPNIRKSVMMSLRISLALMFFTLFVYLLGPKQWVVEWNWYEVGTILLLITYFISFTVGYLLRCDHFSKRPMGESKNGDYLLNCWLKVISKTVFINLILTIANAFLYVNVSNISSLFSRMLVGLATPNVVYYAKDASSHAGSIIVWLTFIYSPWMYITTVLSLFLFRKLHILQKIAVVLSLLVDTARWLAVGTNKGLFDLVLLFIALYLIKRIRYYGSKSERTRRNKRSNRLLLLMVLVIVIVFFAFFGTSISARVGGQYEVQNYQTPPYSLIPEGLRFFVDKFDSYLCQGYDNLERIIEHCSFEWTFGIGNSRFLLGVFDRLFGTNITARTYPYQLSKLGVDPLVSWHSAYAWFASDFSFLGLILFMFIVGYFFAGLAIDIYTMENPVSLALFYLMIQAIFNASCTNYVLAYTYGFSGFWGIFILRFLRRKHVVIWYKDKRLGFK